MVTQVDALKFQQQKAIKEGKLRSWCLKQGYSERFVTEFFCPACEHGEICKAQTKKSSENDKKK